MTKHLNTLPFLIVTLYLSLFNAGSVTAEQKTTILYPFSINAEKDMSFLQKGISDIIESKLESGQHPVTIGDMVDNQDQAVEKASKKSFHYAITGSLTFFGSTISINALFIDVATGNTIVSLNETEKNKDLVFDHIETFANKVNDALGKPPVAPTAPAPLITAPPKTDTSDAILSGDVFKSKEMKLTVTSFSTGDVNGDGKQEIVFTDSTDIYIAIYNGKELQTIDTVKGKKYLVNHYVDTGDINNNGIDEIFITSVHSNGKNLLSYVIEWNGSAFEKTVPKSDWFFAVRRLPDTEKPVLVGQRQALGNKVFSDTMHVLTWDDTKKEYIEGKKLTLPHNKLTIYDFDSADLMNNGSVDLIAYTSSDYLIAFDTDNSEIWKSSNRYGGSYKYIEPRKNEDQSRNYMHPRLYAGDATQDGKTDIITIVNHNSTPRVLSNLRNYKKGHIECLGWKELNVETRWKTQTVSGYISDFNVADITNDGKNELIYSVVVKTGTIIKKRKTYFVIQPLSR